MHCDIGRMIDFKNYVVRVFEMYGSVSETLERVRSEDALFARTGEAEKDGL